MIAAFEGWNDASQAATGAIDHLLQRWESSELAAIEGEDYYDFQVNRPHVRLNKDGDRELEWPMTKVYEVSTPQLKNDFLIVRGVEPSMRWQTFVRELLDLADDYEVASIITFGALLADAPHTRPIPVMVTGSTSVVAQKYGISISKYEGPTGIIGALHDGATQRDIDAISMWASVPHYVSSPPCPKATLALIESLEDFLDVSIELGDLTQRSQSWEKQVDEIAIEDSEVGDYVRQLEKAKDETEDATGDSIAREVERFLRRNSDH
jgi:proteasome assembly chaperone (PAC2) family protein